MIAHVLHAGNINLGFMKALLESVPADEMCEQPAGMVNHPAWQVGHVAWSFGVAAQLLGLEVEIPVEWGLLFERGSTPTTDTAAYPPKEELIARLEAGYARVAQALPEIDADALAQPTPDEQIRTVFPRVGDLVVFLLTSHAGAHAGEIAVWRRLKGMPRAMA